MWICVFDMDRETLGTPVNDGALDVIFRKARTQNKWLDKPVSNEQLLRCMT